MPLESLLGLVGKLQGRIETHGGSLRQSEALTRYALIDPLLRELGWDTGDPDVMRPEFSVGIYGGGNVRPDYVLTHAGKQMIVVEAKKLGGNLQEGVSQGITASVSTGIRYFVATDGKRWEIYETHKLVPIDQKRIASFDLMRGEPSDVCVDTLVLWRHNVASGSIRPAQPPIAGLMSEVSSSAAQSTDAMSVAKPAPVMAQPAPIVSVPQETSTPKRPESSPIIQSSPPATSASYTNDGWQPLSNLEPTYQTVKPTQMMFPDNSPVAMTEWSQLVLRTVRWLTNKGRLGVRHCPIQRKTARYIVADKPIHPDGRDFTTVGEVESLYEVKTLYVELSNTVPDTIENVKFVIECTEMDASEFKVRW